MRFVLSSLAIAMALAFASRASAQDISNTSEQEPVGKSASGVPILHPLSRRMYAAAESGRTVEVPEMMVYVPAGPCTIGSGAAAKTATLDSYCIGKYSVTNADATAFHQQIEDLHLPFGLQNVRHSSVPIAGAAR